MINDDNDYNNNDDKNNHINASNNDKSNCNTYVGAMKSLLIKFFEFCFSKIEQKSDF